MNAAPELPTVLLAGPDEGATARLLRILAEAGCAVSSAYDGPSTFQALSGPSLDLIVLHTTTPGLEGVGLCRRVKWDPDTRLTPVLVIASNGEERIECLEAGADEVLLQPIDRRELVARVRTLTRVKRYTDDLDAAASIIMALAVMIESRDGHTEGHCHRLANYAMAMGRRLNLGAGDLQALHRGGFLHDIGMLAIPDGVLRRTGTLTPDEYETIKAHTVIGDSLLGHLRSLQTVRPIVRSHHERCDGSGYPDALVGDEIPLLAQILSLADAFDALTSPRPYQQAKSSSEALDVLRQEAARGWRRRDLVEHFAAVVGVPSATLES